jgi:hypothetical protein
VTTRGGVAARVLALALAGAAVSHTAPAQQRLTRAQVVAALAAASP